MNIKESIKQPDYYLVVLFKPIVMSGQIIKIILQKQA